MRRSVTAGLRGARGDSAEEDAERAFEKWGLRGRRAWRTTWT